MIHDPNGSIPVRTLNDILAPTPYRTIDYLNIDCEGHDYEALQSIDLDAYRPKIITIEALDETSAAKLREYLISKGYALEEKLHFTLLFVRQRAASSEAAQLQLDKY